MIIPYGASIRLPRAKSGHKLTKHLQILRDLGQQMELDVMFRRTLEDII